MGVKNRIAMLRKERGYNQKEFAAKVGITNWWLCEIESGNRNSPSVKLIKTIADALNVKLSDIFLE